MKILVGYEPSEYSGVSVFDRLGDCTYCRYDRAYLEAHIADFDIIVPHQYEKLDDELLAKGIALKIVATPSTGTDHLDIEAIRRRGLPLVTLNEDRAFIDEISSTAEMAWLLALACARKFPQLTSRVRDERTWVNTDIRGMELRGKTIGIIGLGRLGKIVSRYARAFGLTTIAYDTDPKQFVGVEEVEEVSFDQLLERSDIISLHVKLNETSEQMISDEAVAKMKRGVIIVNTARGGVIDSCAVLQGLAGGIIGAVGLDVVNGEFQSTQLPTDPLVEASFFDPRIIITPHAGGSTHDAHAKVFGKVAELIEKITN